LIVVAICSRFSAMISTSNQFVRSIGSRKSSIGDVTKKRSMNSRT
jgi:hypothetical protein